MSDNNSSKTVIIVSFFSPYPEIRGGRRVLSNLCELLRKQGYRVILVLQTLSLPADHVAAVAERVDELVLVKRPQEQGGVGRRAAGAFLYPFLQWLKGFEWLKRFAPSKLRASWIQQQRSCWPQTQQIVKELAMKRQPTAVIAEYVYMTPCFVGLPDSALKLTHTIDMVSRVGQQVAVFGGDAIGREFTAAEERAALLRGDVIIAVQQREAELFRALAPERRVIVLGYAPPHIVAAPAEPVEQARVLIVGGEHEMNRRGLTLFYQRVWPQILAAIPDAVLAVVGEVGRFLPQGLPRVQVLKMVERLDLEYARATVVVNPVDLGTGLKIKTVEALCFGKALVSTPVGVEGLARDEEPPCVVAADWDAFAAAVIALLRDAAQRRQLEARAVAFAHRHFSENAVFAELDNCLTDHFRRFAPPVV